MIDFKLKEFTDSLSVVAACCPAITPKEVLKNVVVESDGESVQLLASNGEIHMRSVLDIKAQKTKFVLPANRTLQILRELRGESFSLEAEQGKVHIESGMSMFDISVGDVEEFPPFPGFRGENYVIIDGHRLKQMIERSIFATDTESTRYALGGIAIEFENNFLTLAATDSRRLCVNREVATSCGVVHRPEFPPVVPSNAMKLVRSSFGDGESHIAVEGSSVSFRSGQTIVTSNIISGRFPSWRKVVPESGQIRSRTSLVAADLASVIRQALIATNEESRGVDLEFTPENLTVRSTVAEVGSVKSGMPISYEGDSIKITIDGRYLIGALKAVGDGSVEIGLISHDDRLLMTYGTFQYVIMPMSGD